MADMVITATETLVIAGAEYETAIAGEAVTAGMAVYKHTDGTLLKSVTTTAVTAACCGITLNGGAAGQPIRYVKQGPVDPGGTVVVGTVYAVTDTAGGLGDFAERATPDFVTIIGIGITASQIMVNIDMSGIAIAA